MKSPHKAQKFPGLVRHGRGRGTFEARAARGATLDDRDCHDAALFQHCSGGGIGLSDGSEEASEDCFLLDGEAGCLEGGTGILALTADDVGNSNLLRALRHRVGHGVATVQDRSLIGLLQEVTRKLFALLLAPTSMARSNMKVVCTECNVYQLQKLKVVCTLLLPR